MKGDFSRQTFQPPKHYSAVLMQQGRVQLDADWNEQQAIRLYRTETEARDVIGQCGAPKHAAGFEITPDGADLKIGAGRYYVDGILCENSAPPNASYLAQPHLLKPPAVTSLLQEGQIGIVYLDVWQRHVTALDDPYIHETALGEADTTTRLQTVWQVKVLPVETEDERAEAGQLEQERDELRAKLEALQAQNGSPEEIAEIKARLGEIEARLAELDTAVGCDARFDEWDSLTAASSGMLNARTTPGQQAETPCFMPPKAGYLGLENQLYRVEIHQGGLLGTDTITFKWDRNNGSLATTFTVNALDNKKLDVATVGPDDEQAFRNGALAEVYDDTTALGAGPRDRPGTLIEVDTVDRAQRFVKLKAVPPATQGVGKVRHWMGQGVAKPPQSPPVEGDWVALEDGVEVLFGPGVYRTGDYWLIPARTATGEIEWPPFQVPNIVPEPQPPQGIRHHFCRLAMVQRSSGALTLLEDCRLIFPPLTEIDAEDDAHKKHNRYLHGTGVVCGLQVRCDDDRTTVKVNKGYAIACDGADLFVDVAQRIPIVERATARQLLDDGSGKVCLTLREGAGRTPVFDIAASDEDASEKRSPLAQILDNTLLMDIFEGCIQSLVKFAQRQFTEAEPGDTRLVTQPVRRQIAAANLLIQLANKTAGRRVWIARKEHDILEQLYKDLRAFLQSSSYCAMADDLRPFPSYPAALEQARIATAFGKSMAGRVRLRPDGEVAYVFGAEGSNEIHVVDLASEEMVAEIRVPTAEVDVTVQDIVFFSRGERMMVAAAGPGGSLLVQYDVASNTQVGEAITIPERRITRLHNPPTDAGNLHALVKHLGIVRFTPGDFGPDTFSQATVAFNATGHFELGRGFLQRFEFASAANDEGEETDAYNRVVVIDTGLRDRGLQRVFDINLRGTGKDGFALTSSSVGGRQGSATLFVVIDGDSDSAPKRLQVINLNADAALLRELTMPVGGPLQLASSTGFQSVWISLADDFRLLQVNRETQDLGNARSLPVQMFPMGLAAPLGGEKTELVVANQTSRTLSIVGRGATGRFEELEKYRDDLLAAYIDLLGRFGQYLKDCICDHLLVDCPECEPRRPVVLACITIRDNRVYHICNWDRPEVVTFPKLGYWLSAIPVIPLITYAVEQLCCSILPDVLQKRNAFTNRRDFIATPTIAAALQRINPTAFASTLNAGRERVRLVRRHGGASLRKRFDRRVVDRTVPRITRPEIVNRDANEVRDRLSREGIVIEEVRSYDEALPRIPLGEIVLAPLDVRPGDRVNLYTREGNVVFFTRATAAPQTAPSVQPGEVESLRGEMEALRQQLARRDADVASLETRLENLGATERPERQPAETAGLREQLRAREQEIAELRSTLETLRGEVAGLGELRQQVDKLMRHPGLADDQ